MHPQDNPIVVIGASAGGIQALQRIVAEVPAGFSGTIFVVTHIGTSKSQLPAVLGRAANLPVAHGTHGERFRPGHIYIAPPDHHMLVHRETIELSHGPRENHSRPAIDPLFRSAARAHGPRVAGVILSGALSDGVAGLLAIKSRGGTAIIQDPDEALIESMPLSALRSVQADYVLPAGDIGRLLATVGSPPPRKEMLVDETDDVARIKEDFAEQEQDERAGELTMFTCPDCGGTLWQSGSGDYLGFRCHVGHTWGAEALLGHKSVEIEAALWSSVRLFEERASLSRQVAARLRQSNRDGQRAAAVDEGATLDEQHADAIRRLLSEPFNPTTDGPALDVEAEIAD